MAEGKFNVGGVVLERPFKIRRLGHFGFNLANMEAGRHFYVDLLGFKVSDVMDYSLRAKSPEDVAGLGDPNGYFTRYGGDHHAMVLFPKRVRDALGRSEAPGVTINQITWQVGSMREVGMAIQWFNEHGIKQQRSGRDMPGSNWHTYLLDPDGHSNELYYGIEQIGWDGYSKPKSMYDRGFNTPPELPQISEFDEVEQAKANGIDLTSGYHHVDDLPASFDVDGILLPRPFKIVRLGPVYLFADDMAAAEKFYRQRMGFTLTEEVNWQGHRCLFFRCNTEHHSLALFPTAARAALGLSGHSKTAALGLQLANYRQLKDAVAFLRSQGVKVSEAIPSELHPGIDLAAHATDPDGHAIQLYCAMEQIGWDGKPRPKELRQPKPLSDWPATLEANSDVYAGEPFLGPWG
ncbi:MAG TPA: VOC family protein [Candidatus Limnocylindria bacterium]|nr:VOC family protein [Candidatus Limnocylindria bacterium]